MFAGSVSSVTEQSSELPEAAPSGWWARSRLGRLWPGRAARPPAFAADAAVDAAVDATFNTAAERAAAAATNGKAPPCTQSEAFVLEDDALFAQLRAVEGPQFLEEIEVDSPLLAQWRAEGVQVVAPLFNNGALTGVLTLGARKSEQPYTAADRRVLATLADQAAPALQVARLVEEQQLQAVERERMDQELRMARDIQLSLLPRSMPQHPDWLFETRYLPARAVGGDFFDFIELGDGRVGLLIGDVSGKGMPAALIMATTRSILRSLAKGGAAPGELLQRANNLLAEELTPGYFVTCLYAVLDLASGEMLFANAGHNPPFARDPAGVDVAARTLVGADGSAQEGAVVRRLDAAGMPLGLLPNMDYREQCAVLAHGATLLFYSDGITEAHNGERTLFGFGRVQQAMATHGAGFSGGAAGPSAGALDGALDGAAQPSTLDALLAAVNAFTGPVEFQEDDVTLIALHRR